MTHNGTILVSICLFAVGCRPREDTDTEGANPKGGARPVAALNFPPELHVEDAMVNAFVKEAMNVCAGGAYEPFRMLFAASAEPISRKQFDRGWKAVEEIRIRGLAPVPTEGGAPAYMLHAFVRLDVSQLAPDSEPEREVVLMCVREEGNWRLAPAPRNIREWALKKAESEAVDGNPMPSNRTP